VQQRILVWAVVIVLGLVRLFELWLSRRHETRLRIRGGVRFPEDGFGGILLGQLLLFVGLVVEGAILDGARSVDAFTWAFLGAGVLALGLRHWCIWSLGDHWTIFVVVVPNARLVTRGPYRFLRHPNYVAVVLEFVAVLVAFRLWISLAAVAAITLPALAYRIRREEQALRPLRLAERTLRETAPRQTT
jgi:methyltransferase